MIIVWNAESIIALQKPLGSTCIVSYIRHGMVRKPSVTSDMEWWENHEVQTCLATSPWSLWYEDYTGFCTPKDPSFTADFQNQNRIQKENLHKALYQREETSFSTHVLARLFQQVKEIKKYLKKHKKTETTPTPQFEDFVFKMRHWFYFQLRTLKPLAPLTQVGGLK